METSSTDKRIDDLSDRVGRFEDGVNAGFAKADERLERFEDKVDERFERFEDKVDARFERVDTRFERVDARLDTVVTKDEFKAAGEAQLERMERIDARFDRWGKIVASGTATIGVAVILRLLGV